MRRLFTFFLAVAGLTAAAQTDSSSNSLDRVAALHLPRLDGPIPIFYSVEAKPEALRYGKALGDCVAWLSGQLHISVPVNVAVLNQADWNRVGKIYGYPMPQARSDASLLFLPVTLKDFPGQEWIADPDKKLEFIAFHETGHLFQYAQRLEFPDSFLPEFYATTLASSYVLDKRPDLRDSVAHMLSPPARPRYTSLEDLDLAYLDGVGYSNYDWFQTQIVRLAFHFVEGQELLPLVNKLKAAFPANRPMFTSEIIDQLDTIRPGFRAEAGDLAKPTSLPVRTTVACIASPEKETESSTIGVRNTSSRTLTVMKDGKSYPLPPGAYPIRGKIGDQLHLPSGQCVTYVKDPGYIELH